MIIGIGIDSIEISRVSKALERFPHRFLERVFTPWERKLNTTCTYYAKRFAAKEAALKAMGIGLRQGLSWQDIGLRSTALGQPLIEISEKAHTLIKNTHNISSGKITFHVSLCDTKEYAQAMVILELL